MAVEITEYVKALENRIKQLEQMVNEIGFNVRAAKKKRFPKKTQTVSWDSMHRALCVDTLDPWKENRVRFYHPILHHPDTPILGLPFAKPISNAGGFDDCGMNWVPPAGCTLCMVFENGHRDAPYYLGTMWHRDRGPGGRDLGYPVKEYYQVSAGHRHGYNVGPDDESQVFPQWNTESYNNFDTGSITDFVNDTNEQKRMTYPNIYGWKTPEKHMVKMVDGNAKCDRRYKRLEIQSGCGNWMIFKDDHLHYGGQWAHPSCNLDPGGADLSLCSEHSGDQPFFTDPHGKPIEKGSECEGKKSSGKILGGHPSTPGYPPDPPTDYYKNQTGTNQYFKHKNECRPYNGPQTPQNNHCDLPQSGFQFLSISGHSIVADDSVEEPRGKPTWERSLEPFDFGCSDKYLGRFYIKSATGHSFTMSDVEKESNLRGDQNYVEMRSANGNFIQLNDHTIGEKECRPCPPNYAGEKRGVHIGSTSKHEINLVDHMNEQCAPCRKEGGVPVAKATQAYVQVISGYGLEMRFNDDNSQEETQNQWIQITNPQCARNEADPKCNNERGPHFMRFQARPQGEPGIIFLRAGGHAIRSTYDMDIVLVGDKEKNPSDKFTYVSKMHIRATEEVDFRYAGDMHIFFAEKYILLMAGRDCPPAEGKKCRGPCLYPVIVARCPVVCPLTGIVHWTEKAVSERVFASAKNINCISGDVIPPTGQPQPCKEDDKKTTIDTGAGEITITQPGTDTGRDPENGGEFGPSTGDQGNGGGPYTG